MQIKNKTLEIPEDNPFANCKLDRKPFADILTNIVSSFADGFVLAINNDWGTGKTTFLKMWEQYLKNEKFQTIYFNAWENDFDNDPLVAIISELKSLTKDNDKGFKKVLENGSIFIKNALPEIVKGYVKSKGADPDMITSIVKGSTEVLDKAIKDYTTKKQSIVDFRTTLEKFLNTSVSKKPIIFIVDELDRCRPNYAVEVLEKIKHLFSVSGIIFVLSIDKKHLSSSVRGFYGSELIDSDEYLRRFIDLELSMPAPSITQFNNYLCEYYGFIEFLMSANRMRHSEFKDDYSNFINITNSFFTATSSSLRQIERILALTRLILCSYKNDQYILVEILFIVVFLKVMNPDLFKRIETNSLSLQELSDAFCDLVKNMKDTKYDFNALYIEALLLDTFDRNSGPLQNNLFKQNEQGERVLAVKSKIANDPKQRYHANDFLTFLNGIRIKSHYYSNMDVLIRRINLHEQLEIR